MLFIFIIFFKVFRIPAWIVLLCWFHPGRDRVAQRRYSRRIGRVAVWAHIGGFIPACADRLFENPELVAGERSGANSNGPAQRLTDRFSRGWRVSWGGNFGGKMAS
jgi:hypothetical protein